MAIALKFAKDSQGANTFAGTPPDLIQDVYLSNGNASSITVPSDADWYTVSFIYQPGTTCFVDATGATAVAPSSGTFASTTSRLLPSSYLVRAGTVLSVVTVNDNAYVSIGMWQGGHV
jgi:hypothetical protein